MAARTIRTGIGTYVDAGGLTRFGLMGEVVDVHGDDLERFDRLNPTDEAEAVKQAESPTEADETEAAQKAAEDLQQLDLNELRALAAERKVDLAGATKKADIIAAIVAAA